MIADNPKIKIPALDVINKFDLITIYFCEPSAKPNKAAEIQARPFEFGEDGNPIQYATMCPFCTQGFYITPFDITPQFGFFFVACKICEKGYHVASLEPAPLPPFLDPFVDPFTNGLTTSNMDEGLADTLGLQETLISEEQPPIADRLENTLNELSVADKLAGTLDELCAE